MTALACIYKTPRVYVAVAFDRVVGGPNVVAEDARACALDADAMALADLARSVLHAGVEVPRVADWKRVGLGVFAAARVKSWRALHASSKFVMLNSLGDKIQIVPTRNGGTAGDEKGFHELDEEAFVIDESAAEFGSQLLEAFARCR